ncbi:MAG: cytochrome P450 [Gemmatimonadota bacterium]
MGVYYHPLAREIFDDPYPVYRQLRDEAPVYHSTGIGMYAISRFEDVWNALRDHETYCSRFGPAIENPDDNGRKYSIISMDPPRHDRVRSILSRLFTPNRIAALEPDIRRIVRSYLDPLRAGTVVDAAVEIATPIPSDVIGLLLGVPPQDRAQLREWWDIFLSREEGQVEVPQAAVEASRKISDYTRGLIEERRRSPGEDMISLICRDEHLARDGMRIELSDNDVLMFCNLLTAAGSETTAKLIGNALAALADHATERARVFGNPGLMALAVDEALRYDTPSHYVARVTTRDVHLHGATIPEGSWVYLLLGSANRDEREYPDPDRFIADRDPPRAVYFGSGLHICLGQFLARLEARIVLEEFARRFPSYRVVEGSERRVLTATVRGFAHLELAL